METDILSVEDDDTTFDVLRLAFQVCGFSVNLHRAIDGEDALTRLNGWASENPPFLPHLILLDLKLPKKSGFEVLEVLQGHSLLSSIPVVVFTSSPIEAERTRCLNLGAAGFITKPSNFSGVVEAAQRVYARAVSANPPLARLTL